MSKKKKTTWTARGKTCRKGHPDEWTKIARGWKCIHCERSHKRASLKRRRETDPAYTLYVAARARAREKMLPFDVTIEEIRSLYPADGRCPALGIRLLSGRGFAQDTSPTLDRLNPEWGYLPGNLAVISLRANRAKGGMRAAELEQIAAWMRREGMD